MAFSTTDSAPTIAQLKQFPGTEIRVIERIAHVWNSVGIALDFDATGAAVKAIEKERKSPQDSCTNMFTQWLCGSGRPATWRVLIDILNGESQRVLAKELTEAVKRKARS